MILAQLTVIAATLLGLGDPPITVQPSRGDKMLASFQRALAGLDKPSERTLDTMKRYDVERRFRKDVPGTIAKLEVLSRAQPDPDLVYALAELCWIEGKRLDRWRKAEAIERYLDVVTHAYRYLFGPELADRRHPSDPRFRLACDLYNGALDRIIRAALSNNNQVMPEGTIKLKVHGREQILRVALHNSPWKAENVDQIILASDYEVGGLETRSYQYGLGVPLIGIHKPETPGKGEEKFFPPEMAFPLTAFLAPDPRPANAGPDNDGDRTWTLELVDPLVVHQVGTPPAVMPVEADLTTPLAYMWSRTDLNRFRFTGFIRPGREMGRANLMLLRPYEPGKIPVVMVHGLVSNPLAWLPMINGLLYDREIREKYQFMLYMYPTGVAVPIAAAGFRETLVNAQKTYDKLGNDESFKHMVLLGHSMGGLLAHQMAVKSGDRFWELYSDRRFDEIVSPPDQLALLERLLFFEPLPFVERVVFLGTPHRGSDLSRSMLGRVSSSLVSEPDEISNMLARLIKDNPDAFDRKLFRRMPTSIETLEPNHKVLQAILKMDPSPRVHFHSIIGSIRPGPTDTSTDGIVSYSSSHLDGVDSRTKVESEVRVRSGHSVQRDPEAIMEVKRLLYHHIGLDSRQIATPALRRQAEATPEESPPRRD